MANIYGRIYRDWIYDTEEQYNYIKNNANDKDSILATGIKKLDDIYIGFAKGTLNLVTAMSGIGKSTLMMNFSRNVFLNQNKNVLVISLEMPDNQWKLKLDSADFKISYFSYRKGEISTDELNHYKEMIDDRKERLKNKGIHYKIFFAPAGVLSWSKILLEIEKRLPLFVPDIIFIDYLALIDFEKYEKDRRDVLLGQLALKIRSYAQQKNIPIVLAVQAGRSSETKSSSGTRKVDIRISTLEDSNKVGEHADSIIGLDIEKRGDVATKIKASLVKHREGPGRSVELDLKSDICWIGDLDDEGISSFMTERDTFNSQIIDEMSKEKYIDTGIDDLFKDTEEKDVETEEKEESDPQKELFDKMIEITESKKPKKKKQVGFDVDRPDTEIESDLPL